MHCEKLSTDQTIFYSIRIGRLNTLCFHRLIGEIAFCKDFPIKFFRKKAFLWQFDKTKRKFFFFYKSKMILAHHALNFFPCNAKQEINLTLPLVLLRTLVFFETLISITCIYFFPS